MEKDALHTFIISLLFSTLGSSIITLLLLFLLKTFILHRLGLHIENYRSELRNTTESLKAALGIFAHEKNTSYSRIDISYSTELHEIFKLIRALESILNSIFDLPDTDDAKLPGSLVSTINYKTNLAMHSLDSLKIRYRDGMLYYNRTEQDVIDSFIKAAESIYNQLHRINTNLQAFMNTHPSAEQLLDRHSDLIEKMRSFGEKHRNEIKVLVNNVGDTFRLQLGYHRKGKHQSTEE